MIQVITALAVLAMLVAALPVRPAAAQDNTLGGALLGGAAGAIIGLQFEPRGSRYYWYRRRWHDGSYHSARRYHRR